MQCSGKFKRKERIFRKDRLGFNLTFSGLARFYNKHFSRTVQLGRYFTRFHRQSLNYNITCRAGAIFHERLFKIRRFGSKRARLGEEGREGAQERRGLEKGKKPTCEGTEHLPISCSCFAFIFLKCLYR